MQTNIAEAVRASALWGQLAAYQQRPCDRFFHSVKAGDVIYPGCLKSKMAVDTKIAYQLLEELKGQGFLSNLYEVHCSGCGGSKGIFLDSLEEFDPGWHCDFCGKQMSLGDDIIVLFTVGRVWTGTGQAKSL